MSAPWFGPDRPIALAHRGFSRDGLENSMAAFAAAVDLGCRHVETDVHATADGVLVAFHDDTLDRVTDATGAIVDQPWEQVARARIGGREPVPMLEELLTTWPDLRVNVDVKADTAVAPMVELVERLGVHDRVLVASFDDRRRRSVLRHLSAPVATSGGETVTRAFVLATRVPGPWLSRLAVRDVDCLQVPEWSGDTAVVTPATVDAAHDAGVQVHVWTVDDPDDMHRLLDWGVDGIVTDRADLLRDVLVARGQWSGRAG